MASTLCGGPDGLDEQSSNGDSHTLSQDACDGEIAARLMEWVEKS